MSKAHPQCLSACAGQQFIKPSGRSNTPPHPAANAPPGTTGGQAGGQLPSMTGQAEGTATVVAPCDNEQGQSADTQVAGTPGRGGHGKEGLTTQGLTTSGFDQPSGHRDSVVLPQMDGADLQSLHQVSTCCDTTSLSACEYARPCQSKHTMHDELCYQSTGAVCIWYTACCRGRWSSS